MKTNALQHRCLTVCTEVTGGQRWDPYTDHIQFVSLKTFMLQLA